MTGYARELLRSDDVVDALGDGSKTLARFVPGPGLKSDIQEDAEATGGASLGVENKKSFNYRICGIE